VKILTLTIHYGAKRAHDFQSADVGAEMTVQVEEGDKICNTFRAGAKKLAPLVEQEADWRIRQLCDDASAMRRG